MNKNFALILAVLFSYRSFAGGLPVDTEVTYENAGKYQFSVQNIDSGGPDTLLYQVQFSKNLGTCEVGRVQTALYADGREISSSSMDYRVQSEKPSLLAHFPAKSHDLAVTIQYCCTLGLAPGCKKSLSINSLKGWHSAANGS